MSAIIRKSHHEDYLLIANALTNNEIEENTLEAAQRLRNLNALLPVDSLGQKRFKILCNAVDFHVTTAALSRTLYFRAPQPLAVISGAGIAGLAASFELLARGFKVVFAEGRKEFNRFNIFNQNVEVQPFLKKFNLLEKYESIVSRIQEHRCILIEKSKSVKGLGISDVSHLKLDESIAFEPENFGKLFEHDGIYSVGIGVLQNFLAENALEAGANIFGDATVKILSRSKNGGISIVQIADRVLQPDLFFIAEGAHSVTARQLGMKTKEIKTVCSGENWIFGNMSYSGQETFVVSVIDASEPTLRIANVIFNAKSKAINVTVTSDKKVPEDVIREQTIRAAQQVFDQKAYPIEKMDSVLLRTVSKPTHVINRISSPFSIGNIFGIGDSAGPFSPLAGLGGTLGLTLVPRTIIQLLDDYEKRSKNIHANFHKFSEAYTSRWSQKSENIKKFCMSLFEKERGSG